MSETPAVWHRTPKAASPAQTEREPGCALVFDLAAPYVMNAVEPAERAGVEAEIAKCSDCANLVDSVLHTVSLLGLTVPKVAPPATAKMALFSRIDSSPRLESKRPQMAVAIPSIPTTLTLPSSKAFLQPVPEGWGERPTAAQSGQSGSRRFPSRFRPNWQLIATPLATVPLVIALGIVGFWAMNTHADLNDRSAQVQQLNQQIASLNGQVLTLSASLVSIDRFVVADDATTYDMNGGDGKAVGFVTANPGTDQAMLVVNGLEGDSQLYEVLVELSTGSMVSAGEFPVSNEGKGTKVLDLSQPLSSYKAVHVRPKSGDDSYASSDTRLLSAPDTLFAEIDTNLGRPDDTGALTVSYSPSN